ncbi:putative Endonuclease/exonuclease/phosphatase superfamily [Helianthus annuus]|nr:putative Endonuclease/exonuclease/phosphatase superfamily [Helianthus annuus]
MSKLKGINIDLNVLNVYAPQKTGDKRSLWEAISLVKQGSLGLWIMMGDNFNTIRRLEEGKHSRFKPRCAPDFNQFIFDKGLNEYAMKGRKIHLCFESNDNKCSKIDRTLVCNDFFSKWADAMLYAKPRFLSDHSPLVLTTDYSNFGPNPFRFFDSWMDRQDFDSVVSMAMASFSFVGPPNVVLMEKLKHIRTTLKNGERKFGPRRRKGGGFKERLGRSDEKMEDMGLNEEEQWIRDECKRDLLDEGL